MFHIKYRPIAILRMAIAKSTMEHVFLLFINVLLRKLI